jgi:hypothetical protein
MMLRALRDLLGETSTSEWFDSLAAYQYLNQAAREFASRTECCRAEATLTTVASQAAYNLPADFLQLWMLDSKGKPFVKFYDGTTYSWCYWKDYQDIYLANNTTAVARPSTFTVTDNSTLPTQDSGTATSSGAASGGQCTLTDTAATFQTSLISAGDIVHNTTDGSKGYVLSVTSETACVTALFDGSGNDWTSSDAYVIQPQARLKLILDPPPSTAAYSVIVPYVQRPAPVYSNYGRWRIPDAACIHVIQYAAWMMKYKDREPQFGDAFLRSYEEGVRRWASRTQESIRYKEQVKVISLAR